MPRAEDIIGAAMHYIGVPFHHQGRNRKHGLDCIGLIVVVLDDLGITVKDTTTYRNPPDQRQFLQSVKTQAKEKSIADRRPSDLLLIAPRRLIHHAAIMISESEIIHADCARGVEVVGLTAWAGRIRSCFDLRGIDVQ